MDLQKIFLASLNGPLADWLGLEAEAAISSYMDLCPVQDSFRYRAKHLGWKVATLLIDEKGELAQERAAELKRLFDAGTFILGPNREGDALIYGHIRACLSSLTDAWSWIRKFSPPLCHKKAEEIIRNTLWPESVRTVQTVHVRRAVLAAWLTLLRQTTGSCFATAPAILIQQNFPHRFFKDLYDLLTLGQLKRTVAGKEYAVPLSLSMGMADLQKNLTPFPHVEYSPGLRAALEAGGIPLTAPLKQKIDELAPQNMEKLLRSLLLESVGLTEEDVEDEEYLSRIQMTPLLAKQSGVYYQRPSERAQKVAEWKKKFANACMVFQVFTECGLLRAWEYTLASFCDVKTDFARWNLYVGLGLHPDQSGGVGAFLYAQVDAQLQRCNQEVEKLHREYEQEMGSVRAIELMFNASASENRRNQLKAELTMQITAANSVLERRDRMAAKAEAISQFFPSLLEQLYEKLQEYFQELFDPALLGDESPFYDDSPAGFRLVYKHGRRDASQWEAIYNGEQYIDALRDFFSLIEQEIHIPDPMERETVTAITTGLIQFIQEPAFLNVALQRSKALGRKSPWDYVSGGTMETLLQSYCNRDRAFTESRLIAHSEEELLCFLGKEKGKSPILMHSPTHAFLFYPGHLPENSDSLIEDNRRFLGSYSWNESMQEHIAHQLEQRLPEVEKALFLHLFNQKTKTESKMQFREHLIQSLGTRMKNQTALVDSILHENSRLFSAAEAEAALSKIFHFLGRAEKVKKLEGTYFGASDLHRLAKTILLDSMRTALSPNDWDMKIAETMRHLGYSYPYPLIFADTNWSGWFFGFVVNPATARLELWRMNRIATQGFPMSDWKEWMSPKNTSPWILFSRPSEYTDSF